nr:hypothetical protein GCM10025732_00440 [Glycomyces mayteni]
MPGVLVVAAVAPVAAVRVMAAVGGVRAVVRVGVVRRVRIVPLLRLGAVRIVPLVVLPRLVPGVLAMCVVVAPAHWRTPFRLVQQSPDSIPPGGIDATQ